MMVEHMKFYYLDSPCVGVDGSACVLYLRSDSDAYTDDIDYARRFETRAEAEKQVIMKTDGMLVNHRQIRQE
jgi:hypothetical protein